MALETLNRAGKTAGDALKTAGNKIYEVVNAVFTAFFIFGTGLFSGFGAYYLYADMVAVEQALFIGMLIASLTATAVGRMKLRSRYREQEIERLEEIKMVDSQLAI